MAEALLRHEAGERFEALSAGTRPAGVVQPLALATLEELGVSTDGLHSKHLDEVADRPINIAITVCDNASAECPAQLPADFKVHWGMPDPTFHPGTDEERRAFCLQVAQRLREKIIQLSALRFEGQDRELLLAALAALASI